MSLRLHFPLVSDIKNYGLTKTTLTPAGTMTFSDSAGKVGPKAIKITGSQAVDTTEVMNYANFTVSFWYYRYGTGGGTLIRGADKYSIAIDFADGSGGLRAFYWYSTSSYSMINRTAPAINTWVHYTITHDSSTFKLYENGVLITTNASSNTIYAVKPLRLFNNTIAGGYLTNCYINDLRVYDECLTQKQIRELYKTPLISLDGNTLVNNNLILNSDFSNGTSGYSVRNSYGTFSASNNILTLVASKTGAAGTDLEFPTKDRLTTSSSYTFSCDLESSVACTMTCRFGYGTNSPACSVIAGKQHIIVKDIKTGTQLYNFIPYFNKAGTFKFYKPKLELGTTETPYIKNTSETGNNEILTKVYDKSGWQNHATIVGGVSVSQGITDGKENSYLLFDGSTGYLKIDASKCYNIFNNNNKWTIQFGIYPQESGVRDIIFSDYGTTGAGNISIERTTGNILRFYWNGNPDFTSTVSLPANSMSYISIVYDGSNVNFYRNGNQVQVRSGTLSTLTKTGTEFRIGADTRFSDGLPFKGYITRFKIYGTDLNANDILHDFKSNTFLDKSNNLYTHAITEQYSNNGREVLTTNNTLITTDLNETGTRTKFTNSGNIKTPSINAESAILNETDISGDLRANFLGLGDACSFTILSSNDLGTDNSASTIADSKTVVNYIDEYVNDSLTEKAGYTITYTNSADSSAPCKYSLDGGNTWTTITESSGIIKNVKTIKFLLNYNAGMYGCKVVSTTLGLSKDNSTGYTYTDTYTLTEDVTDLTITMTPAK